ncbi:tryptophan 7-halogenase [Thalassotalea agarivorans]|uniref:Tryptophan halogenase n=1 Tax=Thalassotalea agarivorans TaxID=349064 RepID=A0A1H9YBN4_THASX|nr:tryptophan 7-halogenase [Thalassotalea agarivorans]SES65895.1 Tryptophan halogenase [Thalassotalea agarivorans]
MPYTIEIDVHNHSHLMGYGLIQALLSALFIVDKTNNQVTVNILKPADTETVDGVVLLDQHWLHLLAKFDVTEALLLTDADADFVSAQRFENLQTGQYFYQASSEYGIGFEGFAFNQYFSASNLTQHSFDSFCLSALLAKHQKFAHPSKDPTNVASTIEYQLNCDLNQLCDLLAQRLDKQNVNISKQSQPHDLRFACGLTDKVNSLRQRRVVLDRSKVSLPDTYYYQHALGHIIISPSHSNVEVCIVASEENIDALTDYVCRHVIKHEQITWQETNASHHMETTVMSSDGIKLGLSAYANCYHHIGHMTNLRWDLNRLWQYPIFNGYSQALATSFNAQTVLGNSTMNTFYALPAYLWNDVQSVLSQHELDALTYDLEVFTHTGQLPEIEGRQVESKQWIALLMNLGIKQHSVDAIVSHMPTQQIDRQLSQLAQFFSQQSNAFPSKQDYRQTYLKQHQ